MSATYARRRLGSAAQCCFGFQVLGFLPGTTAELETRHAELLVSGVSRHPGELDDFIRHRFAERKPERIEHKFELRASAEACAELARRAGWERVVVEPVIRRVEVADSETGSLL